MTKLAQAAATNKDKENTNRQKKMLFTLSNTKAAINGPEIDAKLLMLLQRPTAVFLTWIGKVSGVIAYCTG